jgi:F-type H+-transporting ATPase subunit b
VTFRSSLRSALLVVAVVSAAAGLSSSALAQSHGEAAPEHEPGGHAAAAAHGAGHHEAPGHINWFYGVLGAKEDVEPSLLWRTPDMPPPFGALLLNTALVFFLLGYFGRRPVGDALKRRKADILRGIDEAAGMKEEAYAQLAGYEAKLEHIQDEIDRVRSEIREVGAAERERILRDAQERRERMEREARTVVALELKASREELKAEAIRSALAASRELLEQRLSLADHDRLVDEYVSGLARAALGGTGGPSRSAAPQSGGEA